MRTNTYCNALLHFLMWPVLWCIIFTVSVSAQHGMQPTFLGELNVSLPPPYDTLHVTVYVAASGNVGGSRCDWYPWTDDFDTRSKSTGTQWYHIDRSACPGGTGDNYIAYGNYSITMEGNSISVDYRDADYEDGNGYGTGYDACDLYVYYNHGDGYFYKDYDLTERIYSTIAIWEDGRKSPATPRIPVTVKTNFGSGSVTVDNSSESSPHQVKWDADNSSHSVNVTSPQSGSYVSFIFSSWSDAGSQSHNVTASLANFGKIWTANFTAKPDAPTNLSYTGGIGDPVQLTWTDNPNQNVIKYYIWRSVNKVASYTKIDSVSSGVQTWTDPVYVYSANADTMLRYRVYAWYASNGVTGLSDAAYLGVTYGIPNNSVRMRAESIAGGDQTADEFLVGSYPNPFNPSTTINYELSKDASVKMEIYDAMGRKVRSLVDGTKSAGYYSVVWNGRNDQGRDVASGVYLYRFTASPTNGERPFTQSGKLMLMK
jgi:hypothetical protein